MTNANQYVQGLISSIEPSMRYDGTKALEQWKEEAKAKLESLLGLDLMKKSDDDHFTMGEETDMGYYTQIPFSFDSEPSYTVPCYLLIPKKIERKPLLICLQGHTTGMHISINRRMWEDDNDSLDGCFDRAFGVIGAKRGYVTVALEQRYMGQCGHMEDTGKPACTQGYSLPDLLLGRNAVGERAWDVMRLIDALYAHRPDLVEYGVACMGTSGGGTTTVYAAALDERIIISNPSASLCTFKDSISPIRHCACNYVPSIARYFDMGDIAALTEPRKLVMSNGKDDPIFPYKGFMETAGIIRDIYTKAGVPDNFVQYIGDGGHRPFTDAVLDIFEKLL